MVAHTYNPSAGKAETGEPEAWHRQSEPVSKETNDYTFRDCSFCGQDIPEDVQVSQLSAVHSCLSSNSNQTLRKLLWIIPSREFYLLRLISLITLIN